MESGDEELQRSKTAENKNIGQITQKYYLKQIYFRNEKQAPVNPGY
jgi:hypothetical protein